MSDYLKILALMNSKTEQSSSIEKNCQIIQVYAFIYKQQKHYSDADLKACEAIPNPLQYQTPQQFDHDYKVWYKSLIDQHLK